MSDSIMIKPGKISLFVILSSATLTVMAGSVIAPVLNLMGEGLGVDPGAARLLITTHGIMIAICSPLIGLLVDKVGVRKPLLFGLLLYGIAGGSGLVINNYYLLITSRIFLGISVATIFTTITVTILNLYEGSQRNKIMGWRGSSNSIGGVIWPLVGGALGVISWHLPFVIYLVGITIAFLAFLVIPETHRRATLPSDREKDERESTFSIFKKNTILFLPYGLVFVGNILLYSIIVFIPKLVEGYGITNTFSVGVFISIVGLSAGITSLFYAKIKARLSYYAIVKITLFMWTLGALLISQANVIGLIPVAIMFFGIGMGMVLPSIAVWVGELVPESFRGRLTSYITFFSYTGQFLSPIILSPIESWLGLSTMFLAIGLTCVILFGLALILLRSKNG